MLQRHARLLLQRLERLRVVVLPEVLEAEADGFLFPVLYGERVEVEVVEGLVEVMGVEVVREMVEVRRMAVKEMKKN